MFLRKWSGFLSCRGGDRSTAVADPVVRLPPDQVGGDRPSGQVIARVVKWYLLGMLGMPRWERWQRSCRGGDRYNRFDVSLDSLIKV
jgi:hypothetical protein